MSATLSAQIQGGVTWTYTNALAGSITPSVQGSFSGTVSLTNGTGAAGTANLIYAAQLTIAGGGNTTIDTNGSLADFFGTTISMVRMKVLFVSLTTATAASDIQVGAGSNPIVNYLGGTAPTVNVRNGGFFVTACSDGTGWPITASTGDILKILNNDGTNTATVQVAIIGSTA